ncbi:MAG: hypothetical protein B7Z62_00260 [Deltaproteobacteria bacterium 37-65-8]|nr:MAG: hypothetical protein B7Z62_00260 [Deltaproteobacteria bacterium 37-65-8]
MPNATQLYHQLLDARLDRACDLARMRADHAALELRIVDAETALRQWNDTQTAAIAGQLHPDTGKPLYSNAEKRAAVLYEMQDKSPEYPVLATAVRELRILAICDRARIDVQLAALENLDARIQWAHTTYTQPTSPAHYADLLDAAAPPPQDWPSIDDRLQPPPPPIILTTDPGDPA